MSRPPITDYRYNTSQNYTPVTTSSSVSISPKPITQTAPFRPQPSQPMFHYNDLNEKINDIEQRLLIDAALLSAKVLELQAEISSLKEELEKSKRISVNNNDNLVRDIG